MSDEFIIKRKLIFDGDGKGEEKKIHAFVKLVPKYILSNEPSNSEATYNKLLAQLETIIAGRKKLELSRKSNTEQMQMFNILQTTYQERIRLIKQDIDKQKNLLRRAKIVKQNYVEYDLLVKTVNKEPTRKEIGKKIESIKKEIKNFVREKNNLDQKLDSRVKQCYVLSTSANTLKGILQDDSVDWENLMDAASTNSEVSELDMQVTLS